MFCVLWPDCRQDARRCEMRRGGMRLQLEPGCNVIMATLKFVRASHIYAICRQAFAHAGAGGPCATLCAMNPGER